MLSDSFCQLSWRYFSRSPVQALAGLEIAVPLSTLSPDTEGPRVEVAAAYVGAATMLRAMSYVLLVVVFESTE